MIIKKDKIDTRWYIYFSNNTFLHFINDWEQLWGKWNWICMHFIHIYAENDIWTGGFEFEVVILGLGFRFRHNYDPSILENYNKEL